MDVNVGTGVFVGDEIEGVSGKFCSVDKAVSSTTFTVGRLETSVAFATNVENACSVANACTVCIARVLTEFGSEGFPNCRVKLHAVTLIRSNTSDRYKKLRFIFYSYNNYIFYLTFLVRKLFHL